MSSVETTINQINKIGTIVNVSVSCINFLIGSIGVLLNIVIFIQPSLRREPCSLYFLSSACFNLFVVFVVIPVRILSSAYNIDLANYNLGICKVEFFSFFVARTISCWLIALACIDRYLQSSSAAHIRRLSSLKIARWAIGITSIGITLLYSHMIVYYEINNVPNQFGSVTPACNAQKGTYRTLISFWYMVLYSACPALLMFIFGCLTLNNIRQRRQIFVMVPAMNQTTRRKETQVLHMLAGQVFVVVISSFPFFVYRVYAAVTANLVKSTLMIAQENLAFQCVGIMTYFAHSSSFYMHTLMGTIFRKELVKIFRRFYHKNRNNLVINQRTTNEIQLSQNNRKIVGTHKGDNSNITRKTNN